MAQSIEEQYQRLYESRLIKAATVAETLLKALVDADGINYLDASGRAKTPRSFLAKAAKTDSDGNPKYSDPLTEIKDQVALRVITYIPEDVARVCNVITDQFEVEENTDKGELTRARGSFGYASYHFLVRLNNRRGRLPENACLAGLTFEIQVRTVVQHAWAEFEHDIRYKQATTIPDDLRAKFDRSFLLAAALLEKADEEFSQIDDLVRQIDRATPAQVAPRQFPTMEPMVDASGAETLPMEADPSETAQAEIRPSRSVANGPLPEEVSPEHHSAYERETPTSTDDHGESSLESTDLRLLLSKLYPDATHSRADHYRWIMKILSRLDVTTVESLHRVLARVDSQAVADAMSYALPPGHVRRLDDDLLAAFGERYLQASIQAADNSSREAIVRSRLKKLRSAGVVLG